MKKSIVCGSCIVLLLALPPLLASFRERQEAAGRSDGTMGWINGLPVGEEEYRLVMNSKVAEVMGEFYRKEGLEDRPGYWSEKEGARPPIARLRELACEELVRIKVIQAWAREHGLLGDSSFEKFRVSFEKENARRREAGRAGTVIYGPAQFELPVYYFLRQGDLQFQVRERLAEQAAPRISDAAIAHFLGESPGSAGKGDDEEMQKRARRILAEREADREMESWPRTARVEWRKDMLRTILPREDPGFEAAKNK